MKLSFKTFMICITIGLIAATSVSAVELSDEEIENIVRRSYQYVAMYNVAVIKIA